MTSPFPSRRLTSPILAQLYLGMALLAIAALTLSGCSPSEPKEISAATSGFLPSDKTKSSDSKTSDSKVAGSKSAVAKSGSTSPAVTKSVEQASKATIAGTSQPTTKALGTRSDGLPVAPELPQVQPGKVDPSIAAKGYMTLTLGKENDGKSLLQFMEKCTRSIKELMADGRQKKIGADLILERGMELARMKLEAANRLAGIAATDDEKAAASLGKMEGLFQMAGFGDVLSSDELRTVVKEELDNADARVSQQARSISFALTVSDYQGGSSKSDQLIAEAKALLSNGEKLSAQTAGPILGAISQAIELLDRQGEEASALDLAKKVEETFRDHEEPNVALTAWQLHASRIPEAMEVAQLPEKSMTGRLDPVAAKAAIDGFMTKLPSTWSAFFLAKNANEVEYSGNVDVAQSMFAAAKLQLSKIKQANVKEELTNVCNQFDLRTGILNNVLDLSSLVDLSGKPIDMSRYQGKVVLIDFWATWCQPCLKELPNIQAVYADKNSAGFEVIGVNMDKDRAALDSFLSTKELPWSTYVSNDPNAVGFEMALAKSTAITAIPFIVIVGKDGKVAAIHVRGPKLESKVVELLAKE